jgi:NADH-quinone oxidoreductase subunit L
VFLTFFGHRRHDAPAPEHPEEEEPAAHPASASARQADPHLSHAHAPAASPGHGAASHHGDHLHDAPPAMALALIVLAIGSVAAGYIGVPHVLGGHNTLAAWLAPSFAPPATEPLRTENQALSEENSGSIEAEGELEGTLMAVSSVVAVAGILLAAFIWLKRREIADSMARTFAPVYRLLLNKYYVDEIYDATVVQPIRVVSQEGLWRGFDVRVIDGAVNGTATIVGASAAALRRLQTGSVRAYASSLFIGVVVVLGYYLWR